MAKILAHMPRRNWPEKYKKVKEYLKRAIDAFLKIDIGNNKVSFLVADNDTYSTKVGGIMDMYGIFNLVFKMENARHIALEQGYDYLFNVEHDNVVPKNALLHLLQWEKDVVGGLYRYRGSRAKGSPIMPDFVGVSAPTALLDKGLFPARLVPWGCTLFSKKALATVSFRDGLDGRYAIDCRKEGIKQWVDWDLRVKHLDWERYI